MAQRGREPGWSLLLNPTPRVIEELGYPSAEALRTDVRQRERAAALAFTAQQEETFAADVVVLAGEVEVLAAAGGRSPAAMYRVPEQALGQLDDESARAVIAVANSAQAVQSLQLGEDVDKPAVLGVIAAAAHQHQHRILALPATEAAATYAGEHRYADTTTAAAAGADNLQSGRWSVPIGGLIIVDDADQLPAAQLHWLTGNAAATNSKLLLITTSGAPQPRHTLTDVLAGQLPWAQQLGTPDPHHPQRGPAMQRTEHHLATTPGADTDQHTQARQLPHRPLPQRHPAQHPPRPRPAPRPQPRHRTRTLTPSQDAGTRRDALQCGGVGRCDFEGRHQASAR